MSTLIADTAAEESVQAVDFRAGQNFGDAQAEKSEHKEQSYQIGGLRKLCKLLISGLDGVLARHRARAVARAHAPTSR